MKHSRFFHGYIPVLSTLIIMHTWLRRRRQSNILAATAVNPLHGKTLRTCIACLEPKLKQRIVCNEFSMNDEFGSEGPNLVILASSSFSLQESSALDF